MSHARTLYVVGTFDTKGAELRYMAEVAGAQAADVVTVDLSTSRRDAGPTSVTAAEVAAHHPDVAMMYSVTDVQGLNRISRQVLANAANAAAGMAMHRAADVAASDDKPGRGRGTVRGAVIALRPHRTPTE